jgi:hypothetical protein
VLDLGLNHCTDIGVIGSMAKIPISKQQTDNVSRPPGPFTLANFTGRERGWRRVGCPHAPRVRLFGWPSNALVARQERVRSASTRPRRAPEQAPSPIPCPRKLRQSPVSHRAVACAEGHPRQCNASMFTLAAVKTPGSSSARLATQGAHARIWDAQGFAYSRICGREQGSACLRRLPNGRAGVDHTLQSCTTSCRTVLRRRDAESARLPVRPAGVRQTMRGRCVLAQTDSYPESSSAARNSLIQWV